MVGLLVLAGSALPAKSGGHRLSFLVDPALDCTLGASTGEFATAGSVTIRAAGKTGAETLSVHVNLRGANPNETYSVVLAQAPADCGEPLGVLTTDGRGSAGERYTVARKAGTSHYWVAAVPNSGLRFLITPAIQIN